jgi:hypothetical protein
MSISPGLYTIQRIFSLASFDFLKEAASPVLNGAPDYRRVKVGGVGFDSLEDRILVPQSAITLDITVDGAVVDSLLITH